MGLSDDNLGGADLTRSVKAGQRGVVRSERVVSRGTGAVALSDLKSELRIEHMQEDLRLRRILQAATATVENAYGLAADEQRVQIGVGGLMGTFRLPRTPASEIVEVEGSDDPASLLTLDASRFRLGPDGTELRVKGATRYSYHSITYDAGYPAREEDVPPHLTQAILLSAVELYEAGATGAEELPDAAKALLREFRRLEV